MAGALLRLAYKNLTEEHLAGIRQDGIDHAGKNGIGRDQIIKCLKGVPGLGKEKIENQLANLKSGGHYTRIMQEVSDLVERETVWP